MNTSPYRVFFTACARFALILALLFTATTVIADGNEGLPLKEPATLQQARNVRAALQFARKQKIDLTKYRTANAAAVRYCPPQPTVYEWLVIVPPVKKGAASKLLLAVPAAGQPWRLHPETLKRLK